MLGGLMQGVAAVVTVETVGRISMGGGGGETCGGKGGGLWRCVQIDADGCLWRGVHDADGWARMGGGGDATDGIRGFKGEKTAVKTA